MAILGDFEEFEGPVPEPPYPYHHFRFHTHVELIFAQKLLSERIKTAQQAS